MGECPGPVGRLFQLMSPTPDEHWMSLALDEARAAAMDGEVPVGAVVVRDGELLATGRNRPIAAHDPSAHAEINALRAAAARLGNYRLAGATVYVTLEPCAMCAMALLHARVARVVFGTPDTKTGAAGSIVDLFAEPRLNHHTAIEGGLLASACAQVLSDFFRERRKPNACPVREDALRTPEARFPPASLPGNHALDLPAAPGLRIHWQQWPAPLGKRALAASGPLWLCIHGMDGWSEQYVSLGPALAAAGAVVLAPDLIGFGRSDKPKKEGVHTPDWHAHILVDLIAHLGTDTGKRAVVVVLPPAMISLVSPLAAHLGERLRGVVIMKNLPCLDATLSAAPFPDRGHEAGPRALATWPGATITDLSSVPIGHFDFAAPDVVAALIRNFA